MGIVTSMVLRMMGRMSREESRHMRGRMMEHFFKGLTAEDRQNMMAEMMPKMMEGINVAEMMPQMVMALMFGMAGGGHADGAAQFSAGNGVSESAAASGPASGMRDMMARVMPQCCAMMLPRMSPEARTEFVLGMVDVLVQQGCACLPDEEKDYFISAVTARVTGSA